MRNFGSDSSLATSQQLYLNHHQLAPLPTSAAQSLQHQHQQLAIVPPVVIPPVKMEPYQPQLPYHYHHAHPLTKTVGVGTTTNLRDTSKSHFSPVNVSNSAPHPSLNSNSNSSVTSSSSSSSDVVGTTSSTTNGIVPINLSHPHHNHNHHAGHSTTTAVVTANTTSVSHLPTVASNAACPAPVSRGSSPPSHLQQISVSGIPYHHQSSHSPTLPVAHTALPSESQNGSSKGPSQSPPASILPDPLGSGTPSPYPHQHISFTKMQTLRNSNSNSPSGDQRASNNSPNYSVKSEVTPTHPTTSVTSGGIPPTDNGNIQQNANSSSSGNTSSLTAQTPAARIVSHNVNGTLAITGIPSNESELQLFRVLQRANLLSYFDMMIELGGDDVQQLCEAGEEEFLEIMALIGMAAKPLHVRRLQKALQEWMTQPSLFQSPVLPPGYQQNYGVSHIDRTISHTQYTTTTIAATNLTGGVGGHSQPHHPMPAIPIPHIVSQTPVSPYPAQNAPSYATEPSQNSSDSNSSQKSGKPSHHHHPKHHSQERSSSPSSSLGSTTTTVGLPVQYLQHGSPVVISSASTSYNLCSSSSSTGQQNSEQNYQNCPSPSGSTSSTISITSHHQFQPHHPPSPMGNSPASPCSSESGRSNISYKHESVESATTSSELGNASSSSSHHDQTNSTQTLDNSTGTAKSSARVVYRSRSGSVCGGSEPSSPRGGMDSPRPSTTESVTNRNSNSVPVPPSSSQDFSSLQEHEIQKLAETAVNLVRSLPENVREPKLSRKIETSSYEFVLRLAEDDPRKMDEIRRLSAIFGKTIGNGDVSGKGRKSSGNGNNSVLELAMNEAAAQLCRLVPALLTKRDEMYNLARQVIRESGLPYAVICANSNLPNAFSSNNNNNNNNNNNEIGIHSLSGKGKFEDIRNSIAHEDRISHEFAAACKKIKLDMHGHDSQDHKKSSPTVLTSENGMQITEIRNVQPRKSREAPRENKFVTTTALERMALVASEYRRNNCNKSSLTTVRT